MNCHKVLFWIITIVVFDENLSLSSSFQQHQSCLNLVTHSLEGSPEPSCKKFCPQRRTRSDGALVSVKGSSYNDSKSQNSLNCEYDCVEDENFQVLPKLSIVGEHVISVQPGLTVARNYCRNFKMQEFVLLRNFCEEIGFVGGLAEFYNFVQFKKREEQRKVIERVVFIDSDRKKNYWEEILIVNGLGKASVVVSENVHPHNSYAATAIHGACCYLYPAFQQLTSQEQQCRFFECMQQVKRDDGYKFLVMQDLLKQQQSCSEKSKNCADIFRVFTARRAQIVTVLALKKSNTDISWQQACACFDKTLQNVPVNYMQELAKSLEEEDGRKHSKVNEKDYLS